MSEKDKMPAHVCQVKVGDSPCAVLERARLRALLEAWYGQWQNQYLVKPSSYDAGAMAALDEVLTLLQEDTRHE